MKYLNCLLLLVLIYSCNNSADNTASADSSMGTYSTTTSTTEKGVVQQEKSRTDTSYMVSDTMRMVPELPPASMPSSTGSGAGHEKISMRRGKKGGRHNHNYPTITQAEPPEQPSPSPPDPSEATEGLLNYNIPSQMYYKKSYTIEFAINRDTADYSIVHDRTSTTAVIQTTSKMQVELIDPEPAGNKAFEIGKVNADIQAVDMGDTTAWYFRVVPMQGGIHELNIVVTVFKDGNVRQRVYTATVKVHAFMVPVKNWFEKNWQWFFTSLLVPLIIWGYKQRGQGGQAGRQP